MLLLQILVIQIESASTKKPPRLVAVNGDWICTEYWDFEGSDHKVCQVKDLHYNVAIK
jgi:hypothetical protein